MLWLTKKELFLATQNKEIATLKDTNKLEMLMLGVLAFFIIFF